MTAFEVNVQWGMRVIDARWEGQMEHLIELVRSVPEETLRRELILFLRQVEEGEPDSMEDVRSLLNKLKDGLRHG